MKELDFAGIDPLRVPEARRRIEALDEYLALPEPTTADAHRMSASIGLSRWQFMRLARVWRDHRRPSMLVVGPRGRATRSYSLDPRAAVIAKEVIEDAGADAELATAAIAIESRCAAEGLAPPSRPTVWNYIRKMRSTGSKHLAGPPRVVVGRMWFHLPIANASGLEAATDMPVVLVAVALPERTILAYSISLDDAAPPDVASLIGKLLRDWTPGNDRRHLVVEENDRYAADDMFASRGLEKLPSHKRSLQRELSRAFGGKLGPLNALYTRGLARPKTKRVVRRQDERIMPAAAVRTIEEAIAAHNGASPLSIKKFGIPAW